MTDDKSTRDAAAASDGSGNDDQVGGLTTAFARLAEMGPSVIALQAALVDGLVRSGRREAERLAALDKEDPLIEVVTRQADQMLQLQQGLTGNFALARRLVDVIGASRMLQGYVTQESGAAAVGYTVRIVPGKGVRAQLARQTEAKTDAQGYFRIQLDLSDDPVTPSDTGSTPKPADKDKPREATQPVTGRRTPLTLSTLAARISSPAKPPDATASSGSSGQAHANATDESAETTIKIEVLDPKGVLVFRDPIPPSLDDLATSFRYYVLPTSGRGK